MSRRTPALAAAALVVAASAVAGAQKVPAPLVASWYAGSGYTSAPYNPSTGSYGPANGKSLMYEFRADGSYIKAFRSTVSNSGCTTELSATESGRMAVRETVLTLTPGKGTISFRSSCAPSMNSDKPNTDLHPEVMSFTFVPDENDRAVVNLRLANEGGASSVFRRVK